MVGPVTCYHYLLIWRSGVSRTRNCAYLATTTPRRKCLSVPHGRQRFSQLIQLCSDGTCVRDYLHVMDLANGHLLALEALAPDSKVFDNCPDPARYKAYNLGKGKGMSVLQIVEAMRKATGFNYQYEVVGRR